MPGSLDGALRDLAARDAILVALDFDGVLAPIVDVPELARALPEAARAVEALRGRDGVHLALVSGRSLTDLLQVASPPDGVLLVGSHGAERAVAGDVAAFPEQDVREGAGPGPAADRNGAERLDRERAALLERVTLALGEISLDCPGTHLELKPAAVVLHTRRAPRSVAAAATERTLAGPATWPGVHVLRGKEVVELSVVGSTKGAALERLRYGLGLTAGGVLFAGDDVTDEHAFAVLDDAAGDVTVKVGSGRTAARHRVDDPAAFAAVLTRLVELTG
ncbi:MAG: trehalose-phosphatase [Actinomycetales bacterium]|nr:trehalose-phosphatase [Actinomycetales bacterium]